MSTEAVTNALIHYGGLTLIHGSALALVTWLLSATLLRRSRPATKAALWTVVLVKFILPPVLPGEMAMSGWVTRAVNGAAATLQGRAESANHFVAAPSSDESLDESVQPFPRESNLSLAIRLLLFCYLFTVVLLSVRALLALKRMRRRIQALALADSDRREEVGRLVERIGLKRAPEVRVTSDDKSPFVVGLRRAVLVLPGGLMRMLEPPEREALILHELAHLRRRDQLIRYLQTLAAILLFFFPPVQWVCRRIEQFTEMACDQWAVTVSKVDPHTYANALVRVVKQMRLLPAAQAELSLVRGVRLLEERLRAVLKDDANGSPRPSALTKVVMMTWILFVLAGGPVADTPKQTLDGSPVTANKAEEVSTKAGGAAAGPPASTRMVAPKDESTPRLPNARMKGNAEKAVTVSRRIEALGRLQSERSHYAYQEGERQGESDYPRQGRSVAERRAIELRAQQGMVPRADDSATDDYEQGFRLGRQYAEERARSSTADLTMSGQEKQGLRTFEEKTRRGIEMRVQGRTKQPPRQ
jgi:beta-lactamase regulating signal transducer with metallopeptidase domain